MAAIPTSDSKNNPLASHEDRVLAASIAVSTLRALDREDLIAYLTIDWSVNFTARLGDASYSNVEGARVRCSLKKFIINNRIARVRFSSVLWPRADETNRRETVIHEICHLVVMHEAHLQGRRSPQVHGNEWKITMLRAGVSPTRCHDVNVIGLKRKSTKTETAHCKCREHTITKSMATKIAKGVPYICRACHTNIKLGAKPSAPANRKSHRRGLQSATEEIIMHNTVSYPGLKHLGFLAVPR